jgi:predicted GNAT family N-acyltransferase
MPMQKFLQNNGFKYCGIIYLEDGNERLAFEKKLDKSNK